MEEWLNVDRVEEWLDVDRVEEKAGMINCAEQSVVCQIILMVSG